MCCVFVLWISLYHYPFGCHFQQVSSTTYPELACLDSNNLEATKYAMIFIISPACCTVKFAFHYGDVIMTTIASQITSLTDVYSIFIQTQIKENIKAPRHWPLCGEFTGTGEFPAQRASYAENVSIWWRHHAMMISRHVNSFHVTGLLLSFFMLWPLPNARVLLFETFQDHVLLK